MVCYLAFHLKQTAGQTAEEMLLWEDISSPQAAAAEVAPLLLWGPLQCSVIFVLLLQINLS